MEKSIRVFEVSFKDQDMILSDIKDMIHKIELAKKEKNPTILPSCLDFMNDNGNCPLMSKCHEIKGNGCVGVE